MKKITRRKFCAEAISAGMVVGVSPLTVAAVSSEGAALKKLYINNRRYLGNKFKLLDQIRQIVDEHCTDVKTFVDIFAGTGSVASAFADKRIITKEAV